MFKLYIFKNNYIKKNSYISSCSKYLMQTSNAPYAVGFLVLFLLLSLSIPQ